MRLLQAYLRARPRRIEHNVRRVRLAPARRPAHLGLVQLSLQLPQLLLLAVEQHGHLQEGQATGMRSVTAAAASKQTAMSTVTAE